jgi:uncharacterized membrane-anchored protein
VGTLYPASWTTFRGTSGFRAAPHWLAVTAVAIFGTMSADFLNKNLGMPLWASTLMLLILQSTVFIAWYVTDKTLDTHSITTHRRELFY